MDHLCKLRGFGLSPHDVCPQCEWDRLVQLGVPSEIALTAARLRGLMAPNDLPQEIIDIVQANFAALEKNYGKKIP
ncbi:MAG: hypothetical protein WD940_02000 [Patescibacteria group bacterium]